MKYLYNAIESLVSGFYSLVLLLLSGMSNGCMDAIRDHGALSDLDWFIDVEKYWWSVFGFTYAVKDPIHLCKVLWGLFIVLSFLVLARSKFVKFFYEWQYLIPFTLFTILAWWAGFILVYKIIL